MESTPWKVIVPPSPRKWTPRRCYVNGHKGNMQPQTGWGPQGKLPPRLSPGKLSELGSVRLLPPDHLQE